MAAELESLQRAVAARFGGGARYVLNLGGFQHPSFTVRAGAQAFHVKLDAELSTWRRVAPVLEARYRAPRLVDWVEIDGHSGAVFEHIEGRHADFALDRGVLGGCVELLGRLHADAELAAALPSAGALADHACEWFLDCCRADLDENPEIAELVGAATVARMREAIDEVEDEVRGSAAFAGAAVAPVHSDLWAHNVLVRPDGEWFVIDWDELRLGDPVVDLAILLWRVPDAERFVERLGAEEKVRWASLERAQLLTEAIDSLADYVEAERAPEHVKTVRAEKWRVHEIAWTEYRARWP